MRTIFSMAMLCCAGMFFLAGCGSGTTPAGSGTDKKAGAGAPTTAKGKRTIAVIPKSTSHEFWKQVEAGALSAIANKNYEIIFKAGEPGDDANAQLTLTDRLMAQGADAVVLAPVHSKFLVQAVDKAFEKKLPMVIIDSGVEADFSKYTAFVATDNSDGGAQCARRMGKVLNGKGSVILMRFEIGSASTMERERGFSETIAKEFPGIKIVADKNAGPTRESSLKNANELLAANPGFDGVFASNESSTFGMLLALREKGLAGKVKFIGFDTAKELVDAVDKGEIEALAAQDPFMIGSEGVTQAINALEGRKAESVVIPAVLKDKAYFKKEADDEKIRKQADDEKKNGTEVASGAEVFAKQSEETRALIAAEEAKQKLLQKEDEAYKKREAEIALLKAELDRKAEAEKVRIEAEFAREQLLAQQQLERETSREAAMQQAVATQTAEQRAIIAAEEAKQKLLSKEDEEYKQREASIAKLKVELDRKAEDEKRKFEAEFAKQQEALRLVQEEEKKREEALVKAAAAQTAEQLKKVEAELARQNASVSEAEAKEKARQAEIKRIQDEDARAAAAVEAKIAAEAKKREELQRQQEEEEKKLAAEVKRIAEESKRKEAEMLKILEARQKAEKK